MPYLLPTRCGDPTCGAIATWRGRCEQHQRPAWQNPSANSQALTGTDRNRWRKLILKSGTVCAWPGCEAPATEADHITELADGGARLDPANGQGLCHEHHVEKTESSRRARATRRRRG